MKILITGSNGMLGRDLVARLQATEHTILKPARSDLDIGVSRSVLAGISTAHPDLVINCAAYTAVDKAESEAHTASLLNREGAKNLAQACKDEGIGLIHISTDYVFDGTSELPYKEDDPANPLSLYGKTKWNGEEAIRSRLPHHLIVRTAWLYGVHGHNFVKTMLRLARDNEELKVVGDQYGCPTWTGDLADGLTTIVEHIAEHKKDLRWGTYHFCGAGRVSWHGFAEAVINEASRREVLKAKRIIPIPTSEYPTPARRPRWSVLDCSKIAKNFGVVPRSWQQGLAEMLNELYSI